MNHTATLYDFATQILASKVFFERSTSVLAEADSEFRPREEMMTVAQQVAHAAQTLNWFIDGASRPEGFDLNFEEESRIWREMKSLTAARVNFVAACERAVQFLRSRTPEELAHPLPPGPIMGGQPMSEIVWAMVEHTAHHRGALCVYARLLGKVPPMPYGG
ncbi:DinB family protein [Telmatobacter sp. DSM 110680]|uniref:DinB family protein n=1 Tax=Telmatobacter sp. DSM 110680 TaxID=3036704 RepID=A0AAU7DKJ5_9BACT